MGGVKVRNFDADWMKFPADPEGRACSPVKEYKLSPEELAKYDNLRKPTGKAPINFNLVRKPKEAEEMLTEKGLEICQENMPIPEKEEESDNVVQVSKTRMEILQEKLTKEQYLTMKEEGLSDKDLLTKIDLPYWVDLLTRLKRKWNINDMGIKKEAQPGLQEQPQQENNQQPDPVPQSEPRPNESRPSGLTINQALALRDELTEDIASLSRILDVADRGAELTDRVIRMLEWQRDNCRGGVDRINQAFNTMVVPL